MWLVPSRLHHVGLAQEGYVAGPITASPCRFGTGRLCGWSHHGYTMQVWHRKVMWLVPSRLHRVGLAQEGYVAGPITATPCRFGTGRLCGWSITATSCRFGTGRLFGWSITATPCRFATGRLFGSSHHGYTV